MSEAAVMIILRLIHILSGAAWFGAVVVLSLYLVPAVRAAGPSAGGVMRELAKRKLGVLMGSMPGLAVLSGLGMFYIAMKNSGSAFAHSPMGRTISVGAALAIVALVYGGAVTGRTVAALDKLGAEMAASGGPPSPEQGQEMLRLQAKLGSSTKIVLVLVLGALSAMAVARYM